MAEQTEEDFGLEEILQEHGFSQTPYSDDARLRLGCTEWHRRDRLGNECYVLDYSNERWMHTAATGDNREAFDRVSGQRAAALDLRLSAFRLSTNPPSKGLSATVHHVTGDILRHKPNQ